MSVLQDLLIANADGIANVLAKCRDALVAARLVKALRLGLQHAGLQTDCPIAKLQCACSNCERSRRATPLRRPAGATYIRLISAVWSSIGRSAAHPIGLPPRRATRKVVCEAAASEGEKGLGGAPYRPANSAQRSWISLRAVSPTGSSAQIVKVDASEGIIMKHKTPASREVHIGVGRRTKPCRHRHYANTASRMGRVPGTGNPFPFRANRSTSSRTSMHNWW
jgi:hypothetical protein